LQRFSLQSAIRIGERLHLILNNMSGRRVLFLVLLAASRAAGETYHLDCLAGSDSANGLSPETAWRTRAAIKDHIFAPGDALLLRRGSRCGGMLSPAGSGTALRPITLGAYGTGPAPIVDGGRDESAIRLFNQQGWHIENIETTGGVRYGIHIGGDNSAMNHFRITNVNVHDVHGPLTSKESGLIVLRAPGPDASIHDVIIDGVTAWNTTQWAGVMVVGAYYQQSLNGPRGSNVTIRNSLVHDVYGDGIILFIVQNGLIERSAAWRTGQQPIKTIGTPNAIWTWMCNECTVQFNESWLSSSPEKDGGAFDIDWGDRNNVVQFNYGHQSKRYCAAIYGAERLETTGTIRDNLCIANSQGPKSGTDFEYYTWNSGWVGGSSIEHNVSCLAPQAESPVLWATTDLNALDVRGLNRFHHNKVYSTGRLLVDAYSPLQLDFNSYWSTAKGSPRFNFNKVSYEGFQAYQAGSGQDANGSYGPMAVPADAEAEILPADVLASYRGSALLVSFLDSSADALGQLAVLRSMQAQYAARGLNVAVGGGPKPSWPLRDLAALSDAETASRLGVQRVPATFLIDAQGTIVKRWDGYASFFQVGPAVSRVLGNELVPGCPAERAMRLPILQGIQMEREAPAVRRPLQPPSRRASSSFVAETGGPALPGDVLHLLGSNLAGEDADLSLTLVYFGSIPTRPLDLVDGTLRVKVPEGTASGIVRVQVEHRGVNSNSIPLPVEVPVQIQKAR
jgi:hypothetical protein